MKQLPAQIVIEKNKLNNPSPWLILLDIMLVDTNNPANTTDYYVVRNNEDVTYDGQLYTAFNFDLDQSRETSKGEVPTLTLRVSNVERLLQADLEQYEGGNGSQVRVTRIHADNLAEDFGALSGLYDVIGCHFDNKWAVFNLGAPNPLNQRFPLERYIGMQCRYVSHFKGVECAYAGVETECNGSLTRCVALANSERFGGFPGMMTNAVQFS